ncbi:hypothetical protein ANN_13234 [Periplaneta americana]|uniref:Uncharacterized protein n=1 Tax=Periplaneta americana TaxID=6978 RepID=A0ABQ8TL25_PERAM|nr:hypothetical protein ANN_13234 [Periplaneta americana]
MLRDWLMPQLTERGVMAQIWFQGDGAPDHFALPVRDFLNVKFPGWIDRGTQTLPSPLSWLPQSPDLTTPDNSLWGFSKEKVAANRFQQMID